MALSRGGRRRLIPILVPLVIVGILVLISGQLPFTSWVGRNGDHFYYGSMALQFAGWSYDDSLREVSSYFSYTRPPSALDFGYLNPRVSALIFPRTALPLLATPFVAMFGLGGLYVPGIVCGVLTVGILVFLCLRRYGWVAALAASVLIVFCAKVTELGFGIYTEALVMLVVTLLLLLLPMDNARRTWRHAATAGVLIAILVFVRQVVIFPLAIVTCGWLQSWWQTKSVRNVWLPFAVVVMAVAGFTGFVAGQWAPYNPFLFLEAVLQVQGVREVLPLLPQRFWTAVTTDTATAWRGDRLQLVIPLLALVGGTRLRATAWPWVTVGVFLAGLVTTALNGTATGFRYLAPALPLMIVLAAVGVSEIARWLAGRILRDHAYGYRSRPPGVGGSAHVIGAHRRCRGPRDDGWRDHRGLSPGPTGLSRATCSQREGVRRQLADPRHRWNVALRRGRCPGVVPVSGWPVLRVQWDGHGAFPHRATSALARPRNSHL